MLESLSQSLQSIPAPLAAAILGFTPLVELSGAIPLGMAFGLRPWESFGYALLGNCIPMLLVYSLGSWWLRWTESRQNWLHRFTEWFTKRAKRGLHGKVNKWGLIGLMLFVALPFPGAGTWTGSVGAFLVGIPPKYALPFIFAGNILNGVIVTFAATGAVAAFKVFL